MRPVARYVHMLMLALAALIGLVPGGLARTICLCPDAPALIGHPGDSCGMVCCEPRHESAPGAPAFAPPAHEQCGACHVLATGEREASPALAGTLELSFTTLPTAPAVCVLPPATLMHVRCTTARVDRGPPGRASNLPLRI